MAIVQPVEISSRRLMKVPSRELPRKKGVNFYVKKNYLFFSRYTKDSDPIERRQNYWFHQNLKLNILEIFLSLSFFKLLLLLFLHFLHQLKVEVTKRYLKESMNY